jgi:hypothetical protein
MYGHVELGDFTHPTFPSQEHPKSQFFYFDYLEFLADLAHDTFERLMKSRKSRKTQKHSSIISSSITLLASRFC